MGAAIFVGRLEMVSFSSSDYHEVSHFCWQFGKRPNQGQAFRSSIGYWDRRSVLL